MLDEPDGDAIGVALTEFEAAVSSRLLRIELHRLGQRTGIASEEIEGWLAGIAIVPMDDAILAAAEAVAPASVATLDAIHLATALRLAAFLAVAYFTSARRTRLVADFWPAESVATAVRV